MAYATEAELAAYLGISEDDLPDESERLLDRASELIDEATRGRATGEAASKATCAQVEFWLEVDEEHDIEGPIQGVIIGRLQIQYGAGPNRIAPTYLAPRARRYLRNAGLLYAAVGMQ